MIHIPGSKTYMDTSSKMFMALGLYNSDGSKAK